MRLRWLLRADGHILVLALVAVVFVLQVCASLRKTPHADPAVVGIAASLLDYGIHANAPEPGSTAKPPPSRSMAPGYPALIAAVAALDPRMARSLRCLAAGQADCLERNSLRALLVLNTLAGLIALALACFLGRELSGSVEIAGLATLLMFIMGRFADLVGGMSPYPILLMLLLGVCALLVVAHRRSSLPVAALAGFALGVLALFEVYYALVLVPVALLLLAAERWRAAPQWRFGLGSAAAFAVAGGVAIAPWMARNYVLFGDVALVQGTEAQLLAQRVAYNSLSPGELLAGLLCWLPGIGDLSSLVLPAGTWRKFEVHHDGSLLQDGVRLFAATYTPKVPGSGSEGQSWYLLHTYVLSDPLQHAASSLLLTLRGLRATGGLLVLWGWLALPLLLRRLRAHGGQGPFMLVAGPLIAIAVVQALLTPNLPWMNLGLVFVYAYAIAAVTGGLELPIVLRRLMAPRDGVERTSGAPYPARVRAGAWPAAARSPI
jgi:4-amino-4-deoxy-L-arabinose transferase-like glycosyltransferase